MYVLLPGTNTSFSLGRDIPTFSLPEVSGHVTCEDRSEKLGLLYFLP
jgi:hypothetical protein